MPPRKGFEKTPVVHRGKIKTSLHPATHSQPLAWAGMPLRARESCWFCVFLRIARDPKAISIATALCIIVGEEGKENSPLLLTRTISPSAKYLNFQAERGDHCCTDLLSMLSLQLDPGLG